MTELELALKVNELLKLTNEEKVISAKVKAAKKELAAYMDENGLEELSTPDVRVIYKEQTSRRFDSDAFQRAMPEMYLSYSKSCCYRPLRLAIVKKARMVA